ncbi:MAG TPA: gamma-glutamylcyclotransferase family protein [Candidatus Angelobacter sp.]
MFTALLSCGEFHHELEALKARFLRLAKIQGELFHIKGKSWPGAFSTSSQDYVRGELYKMAKPAETLKRLDEIEDCKHGLFTRKLVDVWAGGRKVKAWVYFCNREEERAARIASGNFSSPQRKQTRI